MADSFSSLSANLAAAVSAAAAGVVRVDARRRLPATGIVWSADGLVFTASHVVRYEEKISVGLHDGRSVGAQLVGRDRTTDLALLRVEAGDLEPLAHAREQDLAVGQLVLALGRPGQSVQATSGIVSALGSDWRTRWGGNIDRYLQTDVLMYPGFSGGPLIGAGPVLLGLNSSALLQGISVAVPTSTLDRIAQSLVAHGRMRRGYLGVSTQQVRLPQDLRDALGQGSGLLVIDVEPESPAAEGGLSLGDTIVAIEEETIRSHDDLLAQLSGERIGQKVPLKILRGGEVHTLNVKIGERA